MQWTSTIKFRFHFQLLLYSRLSANISRSEAISQSNNLNADISPNDRWEIIQITHLLQLNWFNELRNRLLSPPASMLQMISHFRKVFSFLRADLWQSTISLLNKFTFYFPHINVVVKAITPRFKIVSLHFVASLRVVNLSKDRFNDDINLKCEGLRRSEYTKTNREGYWSIKLSLIVPIRFSANWITISKKSGGLEALHGWRRRFFPEV